MLDRDEAEPDVEGRELRTPAATAGSCKHLAHEWVDKDPSSADSCAACVAEGTTWVHLRMCLKCGNVACCDSSPRRHATRHFHETRHPGPSTETRWLESKRRPRYRGAGACIQSIGEGGG